MQEQADKIKVAREKTFDEMTDQERIQVLRRELRSTNALLMAVHKEFQKLSDHTHLPDGRIAVPYYGGGGAEAGGPIGYRYDPLA